MKRTGNPNEWTDGKDIYIGNPRDGFTKKDKEMKKPNKDDFYSMESYGDDPDAMDTLTISEKDYLEK